jgi:signal transduction histidine kinase
LAIARIANNTTPTVPHVLDQLRADNFFIGKSFSISVYFLSRKCFEQQPDLLLDDVQHSGDHKIEHDRFWFMDGQAEYQVALMIAIGTIGMLLLTAAIILFMVFYQKKMLQEQFKRQQIELEYQHKMMEAALESQEQERRRLAGELHDSIGAMLSTIRVGITTLARQLPDPAPLEQSKEMLDDTITSVRRISRDLMPATLEKFGFAQAVKEMCERFQATSLLPIHYVENGEIKDFDKPRELMLFRIVQELINNALKHSKATEISVTISGGEKLTVSVEDNGIGFNPEEIRSSRENGRGLGLFNMENRARLLNASLEFDLNRLKGSKVTMTVPYEKV